jgi:hypothetical protein
MLTNKHGNSQHSDPKRFSGGNRMLDTEPDGRDLGFGKVWIDIFRPVVWLYIFMANGHLLRRCNLWCSICNSQGAVV